MVEVIQLEIKEDESLAFFTDLHADSTPPESRTDLSYIDTALTKLKSIYEKCSENNVKAVLFGGDFFHKIQTTHECVRKIGSAFLKFKKSGMPVYAIIGNHDIARNQIEKLEKSPISVLFDLGVMEHIHVNRRIVINKSTLITPVGYLDKLVAGNPKAGCNILLAHMFYNASSLMGEGYNIKSQDVPKLNYDAMLLGHDHINYPLIRSANTDIIRPGAVIRGTTHNYNFDRKVGFYTIKNPGKYSTNNVHFIEIGVRPMRDVVSSVILNKRDNLADLSGLMSDLVVRLSESDVKKYDGVLETVKNDKNLPDHIRKLLLRYFQEEGILISEA